MNTQDYEKAKAECWEEFCKKHPLEATASGGIAFRYAYEHAFALGKQFGNPEQLNAEGEEMLTVPRSKVQEKWQRAYEQEAKYSKTEQNPTTREELYYNRGIMSVIDTLFGSKCLPDNVDSLEPKPAEPKFKVGDYARYKGDVHKVVATTKDNRCYLNKILGSIDESDLEPCTEPTANYMQVDYHGADTAASTIADGCQSQPVTDCHDFNRILKDGFRDHNRLQIAAMAMQGILSNGDRMKQYGEIAMRESENLTQLVARNAVRYADALIAEAENNNSITNQ